MVRVSIIAIATFIDTVARTAELEATGNLSLVLIVNGKAAGSFHTSSLSPVDGSSVYQVASLGKQITA